MSTTFDIHWKPVGLLRPVPQYATTACRPHGAKLAGVFCLTHGFKLKVGKGGHIHFPCWDPGDGDRAA